MSSSRLFDPKWARLRQKIEFRIAELKQEARDRGWTVAEVAVEDDPTAKTDATPTLSRREGVVARLTAGERSAQGRPRLVVGLRAGREAWRRCGRQRESGPAAWRQANRGEGARGPRRPAVRHRARGKAAD
ncbi:unnamed protein product [Linum trigynum]|uniref:Uncharacterized protein n=1 Tax=Linum trigynum TaxID=586398 RepID=A0AAV2EDS3_9ROSI